MQASAYVGSVRLFLLLETVLFGAASLVHSGRLVGGYEHFEASTAEGIIAVVLLAGLAVSLAKQDWTRPVGLAAQGFALLGTLVGLFTILIGVGPRTAPDLIFHAAVVILLVWGLVTAARRAGVQSRSR